MSNAISAHALKTKASFHTPGHKGLSWQADGSFAFDCFLKEDVSESVPGMDELAYPAGIIADVETGAARAWDSNCSLLSVNGATAGIIASILLLAKRGTHLLVPRNCHRSVIYGLILSGLKPIWFDTSWEDGWGFWGPPNISQLGDLLEKIHNSNEKTKTGDKINVAGIIITSPTYAGALANIGSLSKLLEKYRFPLVVDEAHGAHLQWTQQRTQAALVAGADIVIHTLHKTLSCPTQIGIVHISHKGHKQYGFTADELRSCLSLVMSSSPNYFFMSSVDKLVTALNSGRAQERIQLVEKLGERIQQFIKRQKQFELYQSDYGNVSTDFLIKHKEINAQKLHDLLAEKGIFTESILGQGLLFFLGIGSQQKDIDLLLTALDEYCLTNNDSPIKAVAYNGNANLTKKPHPIEQIISPREAFFMPSHVVSPATAIGEIAADVYAPCPPGWPALVPGQKITEELLSFKNIKSVRIIKSNSING